MTTQSIIHPIVLKKGKEKSILNRHPWIFSGAIQTLPKDAEEGDIVQVMSFDDKILGYGFYATKSQITVRVFEYNRGFEPSDFFTQSYWSDKILKAWTLRKNNLDFSQTNAFRLIHAEGDFFPGLIADVYNDVVVLQILVTGTEKIIDLIITGLQEIGFEKVYNKSKSSSKFIEKINLSKGWLLGEGDTIISIKENGLTFEIDIENGQKTGFFIDQRDSRKLLGEYSKGKKVLNTFSYNAGFSVYALNNDPQHVTSVDISKDAILEGDKNVSLNFPNHENHTSVVADCFDFLTEMPDNEYDVIILDPPAFAKNAGAVAQAARGYKQINMKAIKKIKPGGYIFTFSCSQNIDKELFQKIVFGAAADAHRNVRVLKHLEQPFCHPVNIYHPEGSYLKGLVLFVE